MANAYLRRAGELVESAIHKHADGALEASTAEALIRKEADDRLCRAAVPAAAVYIAGAPMFAIAAISQVEATAASEGGLLQRALELLTDAARATPQTADGRRFRAQMLNNCQVPTGT